MMKSACQLLVLLPALLSTAFAQKELAQLPANERQLIAITATGSQRFSNAEIASASGLQIGTPLTDDELKRAAVRLADTGAFTDIDYKYSYSSAGTKLEFHVTDAQRFVPARFRDFVWFSDADLRRQIKDHVPLFNGHLPTSGNLADQVSDVLQAMLVEKGVPGHVDYEKVGKTDGPVESIDYRVSEVLIRIRKINFTGAADPELPELEDAARAMEDHEYSRSRLDQLVQRDLLAIYHARGYLKASFSPPQTTAVSQPSAEALQEGPRNQTVVDISFAVTPGEQYKLKSLTWSGNHEFPSDRMQPMVHLQIGQPANTVRLLNDLKQIQKLYGTHGFVTAALKTEAAFDDAAATVAIVVDVNEGFAYHMGDLEFRGLDNSLTAKLRDAWKLRPGDIYDASYLDQYLPQARKLLPVSVDWEVQSHVTANIRDKTVDVDLEYAAKAPK
jgi:outer membrane protein assembly factor BamA